MNNRSPHHLLPLKWTVLTATAAAALTFLVLDAPSAQESPVPRFAVEGTRSFADVIEQVSPAVVSIMVTKSARRLPTAGGPGRGTPPDFGDLFGRFFDMPEPGPGPGPSRGQGAGFIIDEDGLIATNYHVVEGADRVIVRLKSGDELTATVVGEDPQTDLALLRVETDQDLPALEFGDSDRARAGDWVLAIGNPFGLGGSATAGIISARGRDIASGPYDDFLQIDAPINHGNSGGPVFNAAGQVIGINTAIISPNGGNIGIGLAIPSNQAQRVLTDLADSGVVARGWLGVQIQAVDQPMAAALNLGDARGALIADVVASSPAEGAGLVAGDVVIELDGRSIASPRDLGRAVGSRSSGDRIELTIWRDGREQALTVVLGRQHPSTRA